MLSANTEGWPGLYPEKCSQGAYVSEGNMK